MQKLITRASLFEKSSTEVLSRLELCRCDFILKAGPWKQPGARQGGTQALQGSWKDIAAYSRRQMMRVELDTAGAGPGAAPNKSPVTGADACQGLCWVCRSLSLCALLQTYCRSQELSLRLIRRLYSPAAMLVWIILNKINCTIIYYELYYDYIQWMKTAASTKYTPSIYKIYW